MLRAFINRHFLSLDYHSRPRQSQKFLISISSAQLWLETNVVQENKKKKGIETWLTYFTHSSPRVFRVPCSFPMLKFPFQREHAGESLPGIEV